MKPESWKNPVAPAKTDEQRSKELNDQELGAVAAGGADIFPNLPGLYPKKDTQLDDLSKNDSS